MVLSTQNDRVVLVVDDDSALREIVKIGLEKLGNIKCIFAKDGLEALEIARSSRIDFIITDLQMPGMDGITFLSHLMEEFPHIPRAVMTSMGENSQAYAAKTGVVAVIPKPIDISTLAEKVKEWLETYRIHTHTEGVSLVSLLQLIELDQKTCTVGVQDKQNGRIGLLHLHEGKMVNANAGSMTGLDAAMYILQWPDVRVWIHDLATSPEVKIDSSIQAILINAALARDEGKAEALDNSEKVPTPKWIREHKPEEVLFQESSEQPLMENQTQVEEYMPEEEEIVELPQWLTPGAYEEEQKEESNNENEQEQLFLQKVAEVLQKNQVAKSELDLLFDEAIGAFRQKEYEKSKDLWLKAEELAPGHPVIKQNLKILEKYL